MSEIKNLNGKSLAWDKMDNLLPAVVQHYLTGQVLMVGYMNPEALSHTLETEQVTFYSRSKKRLWTKGETSGNVLKLIDISTDCDQDALLVRADPVGPTCHLGSESCFADTQGDFLHQLQALIASRKDADPQSSYTAQLFSKGTKRIAQKVGEEGVEVALAATVNDHEELKNESADLLYHLVVLLQQQGLSLTDVQRTLAERHR